MYIHIFILFLFRTYRGYSLLCLNNMTKYENSATSPTEGSELSSPSMD